MYAKGLHQNGDCGQILSRLSGGTDSVWSIEIGGVHF